VFSIIFNSPEVLPKRQLSKSYSLGTKIILWFIVLPVYPIKSGVDKILWKLQENYGHPKMSWILKIWQSKIEEISENYLGKLG